MINWNNMDTLASYQALQETKKVNLAKKCAVRTVPRV